MRPVIHVREMIGARADGFRVEVPAFDVMPGERLAIVGPSGAGKSTVLDMLAAVLRPAAAGRFVCSAGETETDLGALWTNGDLAGLRRYRADAVGYVLQTGGLVPFLTVAENVALPYWCNGRRLPPGRLAILSDLDVGHLAHRLPRRISVGERQRVAIARALVHGPAIVLADEPTAALDHDRAETVIGILAGMARERGSALVVVSHDTDLVSRHGLTLVRCEPAGPGRSRLAARPSAA